MQAGGLPQPPKPAFIPFQRHSDRTSESTERVPAIPWASELSQAAPAAGPIQQQELADEHGTTAAFGTAVANTARQASGAFAGTTQSVASDTTAVAGDSPGASKPHQPVLSPTGQPRLNPKLRREVPLSGPLHPYLLYCNKCEIVKPPRTHHCRRCGTCVLNMVYLQFWLGGLILIHSFDRTTTARGSEDVSARTTICTFSPSVSGLV